MKKGAFVPTCTFVSIVILKVLIILTFENEYTWQQAMFSRINHYMAVKTLGTTHSGY